MRTEGIYRVIKSRVREGGTELEQGGFHIYDVRKEGGEGKVGNGD